MSKKKRKLTPAERAARKRRKAKSQIVFINGKQKRVKREPMIDGLPAEEFIRRNAGPMWLMQDGDYEKLDAHTQDASSDALAAQKRAEANPAPPPFDDQNPF